MLPILTPSESAALDQASAERGTSVDTLMEHAGRAVARAAVEVAGGAYGRRAVVVCGKGNNGGDGLVAARHLARWVCGVTVVLLVSPRELQGAAARSFARFTERGGRWRPFTGERLSREVARAAVLVDAMFGTGFHGVPEGDYARAIQIVNRGSTGVVAVDIPSGVEGETGAVRGEAVLADVTVALGTLKPGVVFHPGAEHAGVVEVADIGFPEDLVGSDLWMTERQDMAALLPHRQPESHKRDAVVLVVAGSRTMTGAPVLAASAASRAGAGLVTLAVPRGILPTVESAVSETTFLALPETDEGSIDSTATDLILERLPDVDAVAVGPGLTTHPRTQDLVRELVARSPVPVVLDADGLNAFASRGPALAERSADLVITPHPGEFSRLTGISSREVLEDRVGHARKAAAEFHCAVLLKGSRTVVAEPSGRVRVNPTGGPVLATAGTGDVLTGAIAALVARGVAPADAAAAGAYVHGVAGALAGAELGEGTVAGDVLACIPRAIVAIERGTP